MDDNIEVAITPTAHSAKCGYDLIIRTGSHGRAKSDLTPAQLTVVRDVIDRFLAEKGEK